VTVVHFRPGPIEPAIPHDRNRRPAGPLHLSALDTVGMFDELSEKLDGVLGRLKQRGLLTESTIDEGLREIRHALLEADVNYQLAREFLERVRGAGAGRAGAEVGEAGQQIVKIVHDELVTLLGRSSHGLKDGAGGSHGDPAGGAAGIRARRRRRRSWRSGWPGRGSSRCWRRWTCTVRRPSTSWRRWAGRSACRCSRIGRRRTWEAGEAGAGAGAERASPRALILDTAGRLQIDAVADGRAEARVGGDEPTEVLLVADA
jgi:signal recognition particle subunit SRP54